MNSETKICQNCKNQFVIEPEDFQFYEKIKVPPPTFCPECRLQRRLAFRNERSLYKRKCDLCQKDIIAVYSPDKPYKVYCPPCYYSDNWDPLEYGRDYDFSRTFFEQWRELNLAVPQMALFQENSVNSPWINYESDDKNCYLNVGGHFNEDCAYNQYALRCKDVFDNYWMFDSQLAYENILSENCYNLFFSTLCFGCQNTYFSFDCRNCSNVFGCSGLRHKQYYIFNKPVSKDEFGSFIKKNFSGSYKELEKIKKESLDFWKTQPQRALFIDKSVNSIGNFIKESKNCVYCWNTDKSEDSKYCFLVTEVRDSFDTTSVWRSELSYEFLAGLEKLSNNRFSAILIKGASNIEYSYFLFDCHNCFGCSNIKHKNYCILNKQYTKESFNELRAGIIGQMNKAPYIDKKGRIYKYGEFFPYELSPFGYNETTANEYFPLEKQSAIDKGLLWSDYESGIKYVFSDYLIPDEIKDVKDDISEKILKCEVSGKAYRIIPMELAFYRRMGLPIPCVSPFERHKQRLSFIANHRKFYKRKCHRCLKEIDSVYPESEFPLVYCQACYNAEVV